MRAHARRGGAAARVAGSAAGRSPRIAPRTCCARSSRSAAAAAAGGRSGGERVALVVLPGLGNQSSDYDDLCAALAQRGHVARTASVARIDWARNAAGLTDPAYWAGTLNPRPTVDWYLERIDAAVAEARAAADTERVALIAHSAGGWLSRVWLQQRQRASPAHPPPRPCPAARITAVRVDDGPRSAIRLPAGLDDVAAIVTLGSPLRPPPSAPGVIDQTRGILRYVEERCPGPRELAAAGGRFVCVAGRYLRGSERVTDVQAWIVGQGYKQARTRRAARAARARRDIACAAHVGVRGGGGGWGRHHARRVGAAGRRGARDARRRVP